MKKGRKQISIVTFVFICIICLLIGYASISAINITISGGAQANINQGNFVVKFIEETNISPKVTPNGLGTATIVNDTTATFIISGDLRKGNIVNATYKIKNNSNDVGAKLSLQLTNSNDEYFKVIERIEDKELQAGDTTTVTITVEMIENPFEENQQTTITAKLIASPIENESASSNDSDSMQIPKPFAIDSWATIKANVESGNTNQYDIGDTRIISINNKKYTLRLVNKSSHDWCDNEAYSQTACGFVVEFAEVVEKRKINPTRTNAGGWPGTNLYQYANNDFYSNLPNDLKSIIATTRVISGFGCISGWDEYTRVCSNPDNNGNNYITYDKIYIASGTEYLANDKKDSAGDTTTQLDYYIGTVIDGTITRDYESGEETFPTYSRLKKPFENSSGGEGTDSYWLRNASFEYEEGMFRRIMGGSLVNIYANQSAGFVPAFRIE